MELEPAISLPHGLDERLVPSSTNLQPGHSAKLKRLLPRAAHSLLTLLFLSVTSIAQTATPTNIQTATPAPAPPIGSITIAAPSAAPAMLGPLVAKQAATVNAGPLGKIDITGVLSGFASFQRHPDATDGSTRVDLSNAQIFIQKDTGVLQFFLEVGAYDFPALGLPLLSAPSNISDYFGPLPQAYLKVAPTESISFLIGKLPTLIGAEDTFTFENINIERGLLWNQGNDVNRGIQVNYSKGKLSSSLSWNDGFYSNRFNWLTGALTYSPTPADSIELVAGGNLGRTVFTAVATPLYQNNSDIYDLIYTHTAKRWLIQPYFQLTHVPMDLQVGVGHSTFTQGEAILGTYAVSHGFTMAGRAEYISSSGSSSDRSVNLLYGPGSRAWSLTLTPTYQRRAFFARGDVSLTQALNFTPGRAFGPHGADATQARIMLEAGLIF